GCVYMGCIDMYPFLQGLGSQSSSQDAFIPVKLIEFVPRLVLLSGLEGLIPCLLQSSRCTGRSLPLGLSVVQKFLISLAELVSFLQILGPQFCNGFVFVNQFLITHCFYRPFLLDLF